MLGTTTTLLILAVAASSCGLADATLTDADVGNWTVGDCILAQFAMEFDLHSNRSNPNATTDVIYVSPLASSDSDQHYCGNANSTQQDLNLHWFEASPNGTKPLQRNVTITFGRKNTTLYGVQRLYGNFEMGHFDWKDPKTNETVPATSVVSVDTGDIPVLMFKVDFKRSFLCANLGDWSLTTSLHYSFNDKPLGTQLPNATITTKKVQFDAFRTKDSPPNYFRSPQDCDYQPNDIVPIVVGVALAGVVLFVLCAYMYGRRKNRQRGYQSV